MTPQTQNTVIPQERELISLNQAPHRPRTKLILCIEDTMEGESLKDFGCVLDIDDIAWTWCGINGWGCNAIRTWWMHAWVHGRPQPIIQSHIMSMKRN